ncbi:hypothetical protein [Streptomyces sp. NPDC004135]
MEIWAALLAVVGTLAASLGTFVLQDRAQQRRDREAERDQVRRELQRACALYAAAADDVRQLQVQRYTRRVSGNTITTAGPHMPRIDEARAEVTRLRHEIELMTADAGLLAAVTELADHTARLYEGRDEETVHRAVPEAAEAYRAFLAEARRVILVV